jgi:hypothetical protein
MKGSVFTVWSSSDEEEDNEPVRTRIQRKGVGIIEMEYYQDEMVMYCPHCKAAGFKVKLGPKILKPNEVKQPNYDQWLECPDCAEVVASYVVENDASIIVDEVETVNNPFENQTEIIGLEKRGSKTMGKRTRKRNRPHHKDPEIDALMRIYGDLVNVVTDSDP